MKKLWKQIILALASLFLVVGLVFCVLRPAYVREAVELLLKNELQIETDSGTDIKEESSTAADEESEISSDISGE